MHILLGILIVAATAAAPIAERPADAVTIFHSGFEAAGDADFDRWPDGWTRRQGAAYPRYLPIHIRREQPAEGAQSLRIDLDGGAAAVYSPPIEIGSMFSYLVQASVRTEGLINDEAWISVTLLDSRGHEVETLRSAGLRDAASWRRIQLGPLARTSERVTAAVIGLHLGPRDQADLRGTAWFDDVWLGRLPRLSVQLNHPFNIFTEGRPIEATCKVSGMFDLDPTMVCELTDVFGRSVLREERKLVPDATGTRASRTPVRALPGAGGEPFAGSATWQPAITETGFYRMRVCLKGKGGTILERVQPLAVVDSRATPAQGEFGWTLPDGDRGLPIVQLLPQTGINWIKLPVWYSELETQKLDHLLSLTERLAAQRIETVGILADPPAELRPQFGQGSQLFAADIFSTDPKLWYSSLEPVLTRLSLQIRWWQLGHDGDLSLVGYPQLVPTLTRVRKHLQQFGQEVHLGMSWRFVNELPGDGQRPWEFVSLAADPPLTSTELATYLGSSRGGKIRRWVELKPLARDEYSLTTRAADLVHRMLAAKIHQADAIFVPNPFDPDHGLVEPDGTPGELLLPWRTAALALSGSEYLGSLALPQGSTNHLFARQGEVIMAAWNNRPVRETLYLGERVRQNDLWGHSWTPDTEDQQQVIELGPLPGIITGLNEPVVRCNQSVHFVETRLPSLYGVPHENELRLKNFFGQGVSGEVRIHTPESWKTYPRVLHFKLAAGEELRHPVTINLPFDAASGRQNVRIEVDVIADRRYQFSVFRHLEVSLDNLAIEAFTRLNDNGELEVEQRFTNRGNDEVNFKCLLFAPERRRQVSQVIRLGQDTDVKTYRFVNGRELLGKTLLIRAEETNGQRVLNFPFVAEE